MIKKLSHQNTSGFTLAEVIVSSALVVGIMGLMLTTVDQTRRTISSTTTKIAQFQAARTAFDAMTRTLSQATLNTYWDLDVDVNRNPTAYRKQSDLHFLSGKASGFLIGKSGFAPLDYPTHGVFFQAPLGMTYQELDEKVVGGTKSMRTFRSLNNLLSVVGFYVKWGEDQNIPEFIKSSSNSKSKRYRYRLMQVTQSAETVAIYNNDNYKKTKASGANTDARDWMKIALGIKNFSLGTGPKNSSGAAEDKATDFSRSLAENIVALIIIPKVSEVDRVNPESIDDLTDDYEYDSRPQIAYNAQGRFPTVSNLTAGMSISQKKQIHQLPPILQVTMVAIDEESAIRLEDFSDQSQDFSSDLFTKLGSVSNTFQKDLGDLSNTTEKSLIYRLSNPDNKLPTPKLKYRVFTTDVVLRGSKWTKIL